MTNLIDELEEEMILEHMNNGVEGIEFVFNQWDIENLTESIFVFNKIYKQHFIDINDYSVLEKEMMSLAIDSIYASDFMFSYKHTNLPRIKLKHALNIIVKMYDEIYLPGAKKEFIAQLETNKNLSKLEEELIIEEGGY
ncbi:MULTISPECIES: hypothetical protein [Staphylococcus]|uniref:hypothetical protein n=1 Tax=Staphylococcus TaxID=1279 RepID=UPI0021D2B50E|nr:hypothetical protein [Staphylococcus arlettae]UXU48931.1 hypothetical protein MUA37_07615 [Staphylococcus arlettae]